MAEGGIVKSIGGFLRSSFVEGIRGWVATAVVAPLSAAGYLAWTTPLVGGLSGQDRFMEATKPLPEPSVESDYVVLVADFAGDTEGAQSRRVGEALIDQFGAADPASIIKVVYYPRALRLSDKADAAEARADAERAGRGWLERQKADILVWGEVRKDSGELELRLLRAGEAARATMALSDLSFPNALGDQVGGAVAAVIAADAAPAYSGGQFSADVLAPLVARLRPLAGNAGKLPPAARGVVLTSYADAAAQLGAQTGRRGPLEEAAQAYRQAIRAFDKETQSVAWANAQSNLGAALLTLGRQEPGAQRLEEAASAFRAALEIRSREAAPLDWAAAQTNLGAALQAIGEREEGAARLSEAIVAYEAALQEFTRQRAPADWAQTKNNLGAALAALGARETGTQRYADAVEAYRDALKERTQDRAPLDWAATQNNLGAALAAWGERETGTGKLKDAVAAYREALKERTRERNGVEWAATQGNLATALRLIGERDKDAAKLEEAAQAYREALAEATRARAPLDWAIVQNGLGNAEESLGDLGKDKTRYAAAAMAFSEALAGFQEVGAAQYAQIAKGNLDRVRRKQ